MKTEIKFDADTGRPVLRVTCQLKGRSKKQIDADIAAVAAMLASADTRPEGGDSTKIEAPFTGGAVPHEDAADAQQPDPQDTSHKRMGE